MSEREKKIAEIRETVTCFMGAGNDTKYDRALNTLKENAGGWIPFLILELERLEREYAEERAAHNAHVTELCELEKENRKLREERDAVAEGYRQQVELAGELIDKLALVQEREQKLIKKLREITKLLGGVTFTDGRQWGAYNALCDILEEIEKELSNNGKGSR